MLRKTGDQKMINEKSFVNRRVFNVYGTPEAELEVTKPKEYGGLNRIKFLMAYVIITLLIIPITLLLDPTPDGIRGLTFLYVIILMAVGVSRLENAGRKSIYILTLLIPVYGTYTAAVLFFAPEGYADMKNTWKGGLLMGAATLATLIIFAVMGVLTGA